MAVAFIMAGDTDDLAAHFGGLDAARPVPPLTPEERRERERAFDKAFEGIRRTIVIPALTEIYDGLRRRGHRADLGVNRLGAAELRFDFEAVAAEAGPHFVCRFTVEADAAAGFVRITGDGAGRSHAEQLRPEELTAERVSAAALAFVKSVVFR